MWNYQFDIAFAIAIDKMSQSELLENMFNKPLTTCLFLLLLASGTHFLFAGHSEKAAFAAESPDPRVEVLRPTILKLNAIVLVEIEKGLAALQKKDIPSAIENFMTAANIAPYDPMSYILLIKTFLAADQENLAYKWLMISGRNLSDSNQIISNLYQSLKEFHPPLPEENRESSVLIAPFKDNKLCAVSFTFDDGEPSVGRDILPLFD
ncbi:MAG: hypothetical protein JNN05_10465, partial [Candidatus Omnitrophica bacterium]|nr:hypothetical protein [Candidatus Omnitrophota bacterium]